MKRVVLSLFIVLLALSSFTSDRNDARPVKILHQMYDSIRSIRTVKLKIAALERIERKFVTANSEIKLQTNPRKVYFINRHKKLEILYNPDEAGEKAVVKPHVFPYLTMTLDPRGHLMRKNQHYTIHELGFDFIGRSVLLTINKDKDGLSNFLYLGRHLKNGYQCHLLQYENKNYTYTDYVVGERETATSIAFKLCVNDYLLRYRNDLLNDFGYLKKGRVLKVPNLYCQKAILYIDEKMLLPVSVCLYDDVGLFESYDFSSIELNRPFREVEFTRNYKDYGF